MLNQNLFKLMFELVVPCKFVHLPPALLTS